LPAYISALSEERVERMTPRVPMCEERTRRPNNAAPNERSGLSEWSGGWIAGGFVTLAAKPDEDAAEAVAREARRPWRRGVDTQWRGRNFQRRRFNLRRDWRCLTGGRVWTSLQMRSEGQKTRQSAAIPIIRASRWRMQSALPERFFLACGMAWPW
jgi:hypothetical protein